jgi:large subunit ribosomal protein L23
MSIFSKKTKEDDKVKKDEVKVSAVKAVKKEAPVGVITNRPDDKEKKYAHVPAHQILIKPLVTEKGNLLAGSNQYLFEVAKNTNKVEVKKAVEMIYHVKPTSVNIVNVGGKKVRYGRSFGVMKNWKKAIVTLKEGDKISVYEGV